MKMMIVEELTNSGWVELLALPIEGNPTEDEINSGVKEIRDLFYNSDKVELSTNEGIALSIRGVEWKTFRVSVYSHGV